jgi:hypothetical protein
VNLAPIIEQLRVCVPALRLVGGAAQFERAAGALTTLPAAFVLPTKESAAESAFMDQLVEQLVNAEFVVVVAVRNLTDDEGAAAVESLEPVRTAVRDALLGWQPAANAHGCEYASGEIFEFGNGVLWWQDTYRTAYLIRST